MFRPCRVGNQRFISEERGRRSHGPDDEVYLPPFFSGLVLILPHRDKMQVCSRAVKTLDHAMSGHAGTESCNVFVEASGLKYLFNAFMGKVCFDWIRAPFPF